MDFTEKDMTRIKVAIEMLLLDINDYADEAKPGSEIQKGMIREKAQYEALLNKIEEVMK